MRILSDKQVQEKTGLSPSTQWRLTQAGKFPKKVRLSERRSGRFEHEVDRWMESRPREGAERPPGRKGAACHTQR